MIRAGSGDRVRWRESNNERERERRGEEKRGTKLVKSTGRREGAGVCIQHVIQRVVIRPNVYIDAARGRNFCRRSSSVIGPPMEISRARVHCARNTRVQSPDRASERAS